MVVGVGPWPDLLVWLNQQCLVLDLEGGSVYFANKMAPIPSVKRHLVFSKSPFADPNAVGHNQLLPNMPSYTYSVTVDVEVLDIKCHHRTPISMFCGRLQCFNNGMLFVAGGLTWWSGMDAVDPEDLDVGFSIKSI